MLALPLAVLAQPGPFVQDTTSLLTNEVKPSLSAWWGDYDGDGDLDVVVTNNLRGSNSDDLYRNDGGGAYTRSPFRANENSSVVSTSGSWADFDNDGHLDLVTASLNDGALFLNRGVPDFRYIRLPLDLFNDTRDIVVADYNGDGLLDGVLIRGTSVGTGERRNILIEHIGNTGSIVDDTDVDERVDESSTGCWGDVDADGYADLYVTNQETGPNEFFRNEGGTLVRANDPVLDVNYGVSSSCSWGDIDNDGDLDLVTARPFDTAQLFRNDGVAFTEVTENLDINLNPNVGTAWGDIDNDGDLDLVISRDDAVSTLYLNDGTGQFTGTNFGPTDSERPRVTLIDDDEDGDLDMFLPRGNFTRAQANLLYRNTTAGAGNGLAAEGGVNNWLQVRLERTSGRNRFGVGALVYAYATIGGEARTLVRSVEVRSGLGAQNGYRLHFGLGDATTVDSLVVAWPVGVNDGPTVLTGIAANQMLGITGDEDETARLPVAASQSEAEAFAVESVYPNPSAGAVTIAVRSGAEAPVRVEVFDVMGRRVKTLEAGASIGSVVEVAWDGAEEAGRALAGGVYVVRVRQGGEVQTAKITLMR